MTTKDLYYQYPNVFGEHDSDVIKEAMQWAYNLALDHAAEVICFGDTQCDQDEVKNLKITE